MGNPEKQVRGYLRQRRRSRWWVLVVLCLAVAVALGTFYSLSEEGQAQTHSVTVLNCQLKLHEHTEECYDQEDNLICGYADYVVHTHNDDGYDSGGGLQCNLPEVEEHIHEESCYEEEQVLTCGLEESQGHQHDADCYRREQGELICTQEEDAEHQHTDDCYQWNDVLVCGQTEGQGAHTHDESCYSMESVLACGLLELHTHTEECFAKDGTLICGKIELLSHVHSQAEGCFVTVDLSEEQVAAIESETEPTEAAEEPVQTEEIQEELVLPETDQERNLRTYQDDSVLVTVSYGPEAEIPNEAELRVRQLTDQEYEEYAAAYTETVGEDQAPVQYLLDIGFYVEDQEIQPQADITVTIQFLDDSGAVTGDPVTVVHFTQSGGEIVDSTNIDENGATSFRTDGFSVFGVAVGDSEAQDISSYVTMAKFYTKDGVVWSETSSFETEQQVQAKIVFAGIDPVSLKSNTVSIDMPSSMISDSAKGQQHQQPLYDSNYTVHMGSQTPAGHYYFDSDGDLVIVFQEDYIQFAKDSNTKIGGVLEFLFEWEYQQSNGESNTQVVEIGGQQITVEIKEKEKEPETSQPTPGYSGYKWSKNSSSLTVDSSGNGTITYKVMLEVEGDAVDGPLSVQDAFGGLVRDQVQYNNDLQVSGGIQAQWTNSGSGKEIILGSTGTQIQPGKYEVSYSVTVPNVTSSSFTADQLDNSITWKDKDGISHTNTTYTKTSRTAVRKDSYVSDYDTGEIQWTIYVNTGTVPYNLQNETLTDTLPDGTILKPGTQVTVERYNRNGQLQDTKYATVSGQNIFYQFPDGTDYYKITYTTVQEELKLGNNYVVNTVRVDGTASGTATSSQNIYHHELYKTAQVQDPTTLEDGRTVIPITWTVTIRKQTVEQGSVYYDYRDYYSGGSISSLFMTDQQRESLVIKSGDQVIDSSAYTVSAYSKVEKDPWYQGNPDADLGLFQLQFNQDVQGPLTITYTAYEDVSDKVGEVWFSTTNHFDGMGDTSSSQPQIHYVNRTGTLKKYTHGNSTSGDTSTVNISTGNRITWTISLEAASSEEIVLTDTLPEGLRYAEGTTVAYWLPSGWGDYANNYNTATGTGTADWFFANITTQVSGNVITFTIPEESQRKLGGGAGGENIYIYYQTIITDTTLSSFTNTVTDGQEDVDHTAQLERDVLTKEGGYDPETRLINYTILVNPTAADLDPEKDQLWMEDRLQYASGLEKYLTLQDIYLYTVTQDDGQFVLGKLVKKLTQVEATAESFENYTYTYEDDTKTMKVYLPDQTACALVYAYELSDEITLDGTVSVSNKATLHTTKTEHSSTEDSSWTENKSMSGELYTDINSIQITKRDREQYGTVLSGASFRLDYYDPDTKVWKTLMDDAVTGENGTVKIDKLPLDKLCRLTELSAPEGYVVDSTPVYFIIQDTQDEEVTYWTGKLPEQEDISVSQVEIFQKSKASHPVTWFNEPAETYITVQKTWLSYSGAVTSAPGNTTVTFTVTKTLGGISEDYGTYTLPTEDGNWSLQIAVADDGAAYTIQETKITMGNQVFSVETQEDGTQTVGDYNVTYAYGQEARSSIRATEKAALQNRLSRDDQIELLVQKQWFGTAGAQATYQLEYSADGYNWKKYPEGGIDGQGAYSGLLNDSNGWQEKIASLPKTYQYRVRETGDISDFNVTYQVNGGDVTGDQSEPLATSGQIIITNTSTQYTQVSVKKLWKNSGGTDMSNPTDPVTVELIQTVTKTPTVSGGTATITVCTTQYGDGWRGEPAYSTLTENGQPVEIGATVRLRFQVNGGLDYLDEVTGVSKDSIQYVGGYPEWAVDFTVTGDMTISFVTSSWVGNFQLSTITQAPPQTSEDSAEGPVTTDTVLSTIDLTKDNSWQHTWMDLPLKDKDGDAYTYTVQEVLINGKSPEDAEYAAAYTGQGTSSVTITNTSTKDQGYRLPATGAGGNRYPIYAAGAGLIFCVGLMYRIKRRRREDV
jgi:hypothetical protein